MLGLYIHLEFLLFLTLLLPILHYLHLILILNFLNKREANQQLVVAS